MTDLLIDTNILIYAFNRDSVYHKTARSIIENPERNLYIATKNISEYFAVCAKLKIPILTAFEFYNEFKTNSIVLYPTKNSLSIFEHLIQKYAPKGNRVYYVEIISIMLDNGIYDIATFNDKDFINIDEVKLFE